MKGNGNPHPARSVDFLSRLHDGELEAGERARFEAHRAHCSECRRAAIEFEDAISLFRSTRSMPPRTDLATRILRKVQSTNRPRAPFSRKFQLDLGWAALLLTALFAILITRPILVRQPRAVDPPREPTAAPAVAAAPEPEPAPAPPERRVRREKSRLSDGERVHAPESRDETAAARRDADAPTEAQNTAETEPVTVLEKSERVGEDRRAVAAAPPSAAVAQPAGAGGEGDASGRMAGAPVALRLSIREADGFGTPPALASETRITMPVSSRGREYVVLVDVQGKVRSVSPGGPSSSPLSRLRFEPGARPRRLVVRLD